MDFIKGLIREAEVLFEVSSYMSQFDWQNNKIRTAA
jgi:hypothetical protein